jgi:hypothetical protein
MVFVPEIGQTHKPAFSFLHESFIFTVNNKNEGQMFPFFYIHALFNQKENNNLKPGFKKKTSIANN